MKRILTAILLAAGLATTGHAADLKMGFILPSPAADVGWAKQLDLGREAVEAAFGDRVETTMVESVPEGPDAARVMNQMISDGATMLMLGSFGYMNDGLKLARSHPEVAMIHASGYKQADNFATFTARNYEGFYLGGMAAGMVTKSNIIGMVAAFAIPEVVAEVNAITLAAQKVNPEAQVKVIWLNSWFDPPKAQEAARALISQGADVLFSLHQDTPSVVNVAEAEGIYVVNTSSDMSAYGPNSVLASVTNDWSDYFVSLVQDKLDGKFKGADFRGGLSEGAVKMAAWSKDLSDEQMAELKKTEESFAAGQSHAFDGPIIDQDGTERVAAGATLPDGEIFGMNWLVKGVDGSVPN
ncbi:MAG: BMP family ABC transporter substrate-binding protein [Rhizobiaceae bacterium]|nr:BMP family ABC transporter substrate-binding protein [Rhizobiaceae bacterium]